MLASRQNFRLRSKLMFSDNKLEDLAFKVVLVLAVVVVLLDLWVWRVAG
jgi:hypothetical protein